MGPRRLADTLLSLRAGFASYQWLIALPGAALMLAAATVTAFGTLRGRQLASGSLPQAARAEMIGGTALFALFACLTAVASIVLLR